MTEETTPNDFETYGQYTMTPWFHPEVKPVRVGEYQASIKRDPAFRRWWNGEKWSILYFSSDPPSFKVRYRDLFERASDQDRIYWRGIYKPIEGADVKQDKQDEVKENPVV